MGWAAVAGSFMASELPRDFSLVDTEDRIVFCTFGYSDAFGVFQVGPV